MKKNNGSSRLYGLKLCLIALFSISFILPAFSQHTKYETQEITLQVKDKNLSQVLEKISELGNVHFFYNHSILDLNKKVTFDLINRTLKDVVMIVLGDQNVTAEYQPNRTIVLKPIPKSENLLMKISGVVLDATSSNPLPGASVVMKEIKGIGMLTDSKGRFAFEIPQGISALLVSFVGYENEEVKITGNMRDMTIKLSPAIANIENVVITGMTPRKTESFTGSYVTVKGSELKKLNPNNLLQALQLFDPGFRILDNNVQGSNPNALPEFQLRGNSQIGNIGNSEMNMLIGDYSNRPNMPLFILDGFEVTLQRLVDLNPERVQSVTILKDAAATAIYGSRAANGVVVFETKKPAPGALNINYSTNIGITTPDLTGYNLMNAEEKLQFEYDAGLFTKDADGNNLGSEQLANKLNYYNKYKRELLNGVNTYWLSAPLRTAILQRHNISVDGGDEALRYNLNLNYGNSPGVMKKSSRENMGLGLNLSYRRKGWIVSNNLSVNNTKANETPYGAFNLYTSLNPYYRKTDEHGNFTNLIENKPMAPGQNAILQTNPLYNVGFPYKNVTTNFNVTDNFYIEYAIRQNLRVSSSASLTKSDALAEIFKSMNHTDFVDEEDLTKRGSYDKDIGKSLSWNVNASINYNLTRGKHLISSLARWDIRETNMDAVFFSAKGFPNDNMTDFLFATEIENRVNGNESTTRTIGLIGQVSYMYDYRYSVDLSARSDMASQFGANSRFAPFWAAGFRWNASREKFLENTAVSNLVFRASYGITGSQNYQPYQALQSYTFANMMFPYSNMGVLGAELMGHGNPNLSWSKTKERNVSLEIGFWNGRLNGSLNYYNNFTDQLLLDYSLAPSTGFPSTMTNVGAIKNVGYEASVSFMPIRNFQRQIQWIVTVNAASNRNTIQKISNEIEKMNEENRKNPGAPLPIYEQGKSTSQLWVVRSLGIDPASGREVFLKRSGEKTFVWNPADKIAIGDGQPRVQGAITSSLTWKNWSAGVGITYQAGAYIYNNTLVDRIENINIGKNLDKRAAENRWRAPGDVALYKSIALLGHVTESSSRFVQELNEIRFGAISLGYMFDSKHSRLLRNSRIASLSLNGAVNDLGTISSVRQERGLEYPYARSFNLSLNVLFK